jgi:hypothetical protein
MAKLTTELHASVKVGGEEVLFTFRQPTNKELNEFLGKRYELRGAKRLSDNSLNARTGFFDLLLTDIRNLEDDQGAAITPERAELIPATWKNDLIFKLFEDNEIEIKN